MTPIRTSIRDHVLTLQLTVAWAGEANTDPPRLGWWRTSMTDEFGRVDLFKRLAPTPPGTRRAASSSESPYDLPGARNGRDEVAGYGLFGAFHRRATFRVVGGRRQRLGNRDRAVQRPVRCQAEI